MRCCVAILLIGMGMLLFSSKGSDAQWVQTSWPTGGGINALVVIGKNLFANFDGSVFLSTDNGKSWKAVNSGLTDTWVHCLAVSGTNLFVGADGGVFRSTNNGTSWEAVNLGSPEGIQVWNLAVSGTYIFATTWWYGAFLSTNSGSGWTRVGGPEFYVRCLAVSATNLFAGTNKGVYLSTNNGKRWKAINSGLPGKPIVYCLAVSGKDLFAGIDGGVFLSTDNGASWTAVNSGLPGKPIVYCLEVVGKNLLTGINGGVFLSTNSGKNWTAVNTGLPKYIKVDCLAMSGMNLFSGTFRNGVWRLSLSDLLMKNDKQCLLEALKSVPQLGPSPHVRKDADLGIAEVEGAKKRLAGLKNSNGGDSQ